MQVPDFREAKVEEVFIHYSGSKANGHLPETCNEPLKLDEAILSDFFITWVTRPHRTDRVFKFRNANKAFKHVMHDIARNYFNKKKTLFQISQELTEHIYHQMTYPEIPEGEVVVCDIQNIHFFGKKRNALALVKIDVKEPFLMMGSEKNKNTLQAMYGLYLKKPCKSALIFFDEEVKDYFVLVHDDARYDGPGAGYWPADVLNVEPMEGNYFNTEHFLKVVRKFGDEVLTAENQIDNLDKKVFLHKNIDYFKNHTVYEPKSYEEQVLQLPELRNSFYEYARTEDPNWDQLYVRDFDISAHAIKKNQKYFKSIIKLDSNFHIYAHGRFDLVEKGFDEEKGMKYYKLYYETEH
jgi:hypothetical protein